jgi:uncharacterized protein (DUF433 family)
MDTPSPTKWKYLGPKPGSAYKQLFIKGTRIMARIISATFHDEENPLTPEEIARDFNIPVETVREAIAYCDKATANRLRSRKIGSARKRSFASGFSRIQTTVSRALRRSEWNSWQSEGASRPRGNETLSRR